jgi:hypothetical protein
MADAFDRFTAELTAVLKAKGVSGIGQIAERLKPVLLDTAFATRAFPDETKRKRELFYDPETDVHVYAHIHEGPKRGKPHSHGASWAVYGNVKGVTTMTEWQRVNRDGDGGVILETVERYQLGPGDTRAYPPHAIHSTEHPEKALVIRITGTDLAKIERYSFNPETDVMMETV